MHFEVKEILLALLGGAFIALSSTLNLLLNGRITGMSSIFYTISTHNTKEGFTWKLMFLLGLICPVYILYLCADDDGTIQETAYFNPKYVNIWALLLGGVLVGIGTKTGNGCTSGHAVCGIPRLAKRSIVATSLFLAFGIGTAMLFWHLEWIRGVDTASDWGTDYEDTGFKIMTYVMTLAVLCTGVVMAAMEVRSGGKSKKDLVVDFALSFLIGAIFGTGLAVSGMCNPRKIVGFLTIDPDTWDPSLIFVMVSAVGINLVTFQLILRKAKAPLLQGKFQSPKSEFDVPVIVGPILFGIGWGISGLCPGPGMLNLFMLPQGFLFVAALAAGMQIATRVVVPLLEAKKSVVSPAAPASAAVTPSSSASASVNGVSISSSK